SEPGFKLIVNFNVELTQANHRKVYKGIWIFKYFGACELMSRWQGTRLCEPLFADGSGEYSDPLEP
ncbi:MAG: hypothetical protein QXZ22_08540, partial [Sulfolobales archaeon]